jgi:histidinol dehydrogenase
MMKIIQSKDRAAMDRLMGAREARVSGAEPVARRIIEDVKRHGDRALIRYAKKFDRLDLVKEGFTVSKKEIREAYRNVPGGFVRALRLAAGNIRAVARRQLPQPWRVETSPGVVVRQITRPLNRVACYVPGGRFPLPSTVLMSVIPAQVAAVREIVVTSPRPAPAVLVAADILGIKKIYRLSGAQAIAAFAYGTASVPRADKIIGPGNRFVAAAKKIVARDCGIDFVAGPTELVMVGSGGRPQWIAADLVAQAEHDPDAVAIFITPSRQLATKVQTAAHNLVRQLRLPVAEQALLRQGAIILTRTISEAVDLANIFAPEHLTLLDGAASFLGHIQSAGSIFVGRYSAVAAGDYASGTNHILPTGGEARLRGGLSAADFVKTISVQQLSARGLSRLRKAIVTLATTEGLRAHADSVETRFDSRRGEAG